MRVREEREAGFLAAVNEEQARACEVFSPFNSPHEAYAVILEELDEFKKQVWRQPAKRKRGIMLKELVQIAAMCERAACDLYLFPDDPSY